jgi:hypothetical protein
VRQTYNALREVAFELSSSELLVRLVLLDRARRHCVDVVELPFEVLRSNRRHGRVTPAFENCRIRLAYTLNCRNGIVIISARPDEGAVDFLSAGTNAIQLPLNLLPTNETIWHVALSQLSAPFQLLAWHWRVEVGVAGP